MFLAFVAGWILGSVSLYSYMIMSSRETPFPECMDCRAAECGTCPQTATDSGRYRLAA